MASVASVNVFEDTSDNPPFEGPEKLLEAWFASSEDAGNVRGNGLRKIPRSVWEDMLDLVRCKVLSVIEGEDVDAYLLSESSMFVWPHKIILKTCGTTTLLLGLDRLLAIAEEYCGFNDVWRCFYSRKAFMFPERQQGPHKTWDDEVHFLDKSLGHGSGSAYCVGKMNGDHWLLYLTAPRDEPGPVAVDEDSLVEQMLSSSLGSPVASSSKLPSASITVKPPSPPDQTLEILMTELDGSACKEFFYPEGTVSANVTDGVDDQQGHPAGTQVSKRLGIDKLLPGATVDSFLFTPCGYSANIVQDDRYATIHVTPESDWSYASFECNVDFRGSDGKTDDELRRQHHDSESLHTLVENVLSIFRPGRFSLTLFVSVEESHAGIDAGSTPETRQILDPRIADGYTRTDRILYEFAGYHLLFSTFVKLK